MTTHKQKMLNFALDKLNSTVDKLYWQNGFKSFAESIQNLQEFTSRHLPPDREEEFWRKYLKEVKEHIQQIKDGRDDSDDSQSPTHYCFLTINYDDSKPITIDIMHKVAQIILSYDFVKKAMYVHEKHGADGNIHHHTHMLIVPKRKTFASKYTESPYKNREIKKWISGKQFLDAKLPGTKNFPPPFEVCVNYVRGVKTDSKESCVEKDRAWRTSLGYDHFYEHNWS
jgi:hypothetical protein